MMTTRLTLKLGLLQGRSCHPTMLHKVFALLHLDDGSFLSDVEKSFLLDFEEHAWVTIE